MDINEYIEEHYTSCSNDESVPAFMYLSHEIVMRFHSEYDEINNVLPMAKLENIDWAELRLEIIDNLLEYDFFLFDEQKEILINLPAKRVW